MKTAENFNVYTTKDYSIFKFIESNRKVEYSKSLEDSISKNGLISPIIVSDNGLIIDGQHRLMVLKKLKMPVTYIVNNSFCDKMLIEANNIQKKWKLIDYVWYWKKHGNVDISLLHDKIEQHHENYKPSIISQIYAVSRSGYLGNIKKGVYKIDEKYGDYFISEMKKLKPHTTHWNSDRVSKAIDFIMKRNPYFMVDTFIKKLKYNKLKIYIRLDDNVETILEIYNYNNRKKIKL